MSEYVVGDIVVLPLGRIVKLLSFKPEQHSWETLYLFDPASSKIPRGSTHRWDVKFLNKYGRKLLPHEVTVAILSDMIDSNHLNHSTK